MRTVLAVLALTLVCAGCLVRVQPQGHTGERRCPPGHEWSDGRCHEKGHGHDRR